MSEFQYVAFRAIDGPVSGKNLEFMEEQSSRAEITPWTFDNEYNYGDFRGDAAEMLRRGYDFHFHYANFGTRTLMIRLPNGLPDPKAAEPYLQSDSLTFLKDKKGPGGILTVEPGHEPGELEDLWDLDEIVDCLLPLRAEILDGDLRPLYLAHLGIASDMNHDPSEETEGPVPLGLDQLTKAQKALAELYGLSDGLIMAAAKGCPPLPKRKEVTSNYSEWLLQQPEAKRNEWLAQWMADPDSTARREMLEAFQKSQNTSSWPTIQLNRTVAELQTASEEIHRELEQKKAEKAAREKAKNRAEMAADPEPTLRKTEELVKVRGTDSYEKIANLLAELREALAGTDQANLAEEQAVKLKTNNPTLKTLVSALRKKGFLKK